MPATKKVDNNIRYGGGAIIDESLKSHANDPFVIKKAEQAKAILSKIVLPQIEKK